MNKAFTNEKTKRAVIIGASMGGLLTAKILSEYFTEIVMIEKDKLPDEAVDRAGTPQGFHPHRFTPRLVLILNRLFPGYQDILLENGAPTTYNKYMHQINHYGKVVIGPSQEREITCSRALVEWTIRGYIRKLPNVKILDQQEVLNLQTNSDGTQVTGVVFRDRVSRQEKSIFADIVVDTSGRRSKLASWLQNLGYEVPAPDRLKVSLAYSTRRFRISTELAKKWDVIRIAGHPSTNTFTGVFSTIEDGVAEVLLYGLGGKYPTIRPDKFYEEASRLSDPSISEMIQKMEPITTPRGFQVPELVRQRFDKMKNWPAGLLVLGDALCHVDPIFGQGITMAAIETEVLEDCIKEQQKNPIQNFEQYVLSRIQAAIEPGWWLNCAADIAWSGVEYVGEPLKGLQFASKYLDLYLKHVTIRQNLPHYGLYWAVNSLLLSPRKIFNIEMISAVMVDATDEDREWYNEFTHGIGQLTEEQLDQMIPSFSGASFVNE